MNKKKKLNYLPIDPLSEILPATTAVGSSAQLLELPKLRLITSQPIIFGISINANIPLAKKK